ncbi:MAG: hypothetical protein WBV98_08310, partial [Candidatus Sulfotelmatobacter sp.]
HAPTDQKKTLLYIAASRNLGTLIAPPKASIGDQRRAFAFQRVVARHAMHRLSDRRTLSKQQ